MSPLYHPVQLPLFVFKVCPACVPPIEKPIEEFAKDRTHPSGHARYCKACNYRKIRAIQAKGTPAYAKKLAYDRKYSARRSRKPYKVDRAANNARSLAYAKLHPKKMAEAVARRNALKKSLTVEKVDYERILERNGYICHICERTIDPTIKKGPASLAFDHMVPLRPRYGEPQGTHSEDNIKPAHSVCNYRKNNRRLEDLTPYQRRGVD